MKYIKLFEQFDEEEAWWDEPDPLDQTKLKVIKGGNQYYLLKEIIGDGIRLFDEGNYIYPKNRFDIDPLWDRDRDKITIITDDGTGRGNYSWREYSYEDIPKEIRDRIDI